MASSAMAGSSIVAHRSGSMYEITAEGSPLGGKLHSTNLAYELRRLLSRSTFEVEHIPEGARVTTVTQRAPSAADQAIHAMTAVPVDHPDRAALRARAIEAWLPLARHLAA